MHPPTLLGPLIRQPADRCVVVDNVAERYLHLLYQPMLAKTRPIQSF